MAEPGAGVALASVAGPAAEAAAAVAMAVGVPVAVTAAVSLVAPTAALSCVSLFERYKTPATTPARAKKTSTNGTGERFDGAVAGAGRTARPSDAPAVVERDAGFGPDAGAGVGFASAALARLGTSGGGAVGSRASVAAVSATGMGCVAGANGEM
jgi:hypothetical protein